MKSRRQTRVYIHNFIKASQACRIHTFRRKKRPAKIPANISPPHSRGEENQYIYIYTAVGQTNQHQKKRRRQKQNQRAANLAYTLAKIPANEITLSLSLSFWFGSTLSRPQLSPISFLSSLGVYTHTHIQRERERESQRRAVYKRDNRIFNLGRERVGVCLHLSMLLRGLYCVGVLVLGCVWKRISVS